MSRPTQTFTTALLALLLLLLTQAAPAQAAEVVGPLPQASAMQELPRDSRPQRALRTTRAVAVAGGLVMATSLCAWPLLSAHFGPAPFMAHLIVPALQVAGPFVIGAVLTTVGLVGQRIARRNGALASSTAHRNHTLMVVYSGLLMSTTAAFVAISALRGFHPTVYSLGIDIGLGVLAGGTGYGLLIAGVAGLRADRIGVAPMVLPQGGGLAMGGVF